MKGIVPIFSDLDGKMEGHFGGREELLTSYYNKIAKSGHMCALNAGYSYGYSTEI
jgi:hypothetical protein